MDDIPFKSNISNDEEQALIEMTHNKNIVIKPTNKGNGIAIMNTRDYVDKIFQHLSDTSLYKKVDQDYTPYVYNEIDSYLAYLKYSRKIDHSILKHLLPPSPKSNSSPLLPT